MTEDNETKEWEIGEKSITNIKIEGYTTVDKYDDTGEFPENVFRVEYITIPDMTCEFGDYSGQDVKIYLSTDSLWELIGHYSNRRRNPIKSVKNFSDDYNLEEILLESALPEKFKEVMRFNLR